MGSLLPKGVIPLTSDSTDKCLFVVLIRISKLMLASGTPQYCKDLSLISKSMLASYPFLPPPHLLLLRGIPLRSCSLSLEPHSSCYVPPFCLCSSHCVFSILHSPLLFFLTDRPGHGQPTSFSLCSGLFHMPLALLSYRQ